MTLEELKKRILDTGYLPEWLKESVGLMGSGVAPVVLPVTAPPQPENKKWCPFASVRLAQATGGASFNRIVNVPTQGVTEITTVGAYCIEGSCQMWTGSGCGMANINADITAYIDEKFDRVHGPVDAV